MVLKSLKVLENLFKKFKTLKGAEKRNWVFKSFEIIRNTISSYNFASYSWGCSVFYEIFLDKKLYMACTEGDNVIMSKIIQKTPGKL